MASISNHDTNHFLLLATVSLANMVTPLNSTMLTVALPEIRTEFAAGHAEVAWLVSAYLIAMAVAQPVGGRLSDQVGHARMLRFGLGAFALFSVVAAAAPSFALLVVFRTCQAIVGAALIPAGLAMLRNSVPPGRLGTSAGITQSLLGLSTAIGPLIGAALLTIGAWRWLFLVNVPLVLGALLCLSFLHYTEAKPPGKLQIDFAGVAGLVGMLAAITYVMGTGRNSSGLAEVAGITVAIAFGAFFWQSQIRGSTSVGEWRLFKSRSYLAATIYVMFTYAVLYTLVVAVPFFLREVKDYSSAATGAVLSLMTVTMAIMSLAGGRLSDNWGRRPVSVVGGILLVLACSVLSVGISDGSSVVVLASALVLVGAGAGIGMNTASLAAVESAPSSKAGTAAGTASMMRYIGGVLGAGILGLVLSRDGEVPDVEVFRILFGVLLAASLLVAASSFSIHRFTTQSQ